MKCNSKFFLITLIQVLVFSACSQVQNGDFEYPSGQVSDTQKADSLYTLAIDVKENEPDYNKALLFRNEYGWQLNKVEQLKNDIPEILRLKEYQGEFKYQEIFDPQNYPPDYWQQFYEIASELKNHFKKGTPEYRENLGILTYTEILLNKNDMLLSDLPELLGAIDSKSDNYFFMLWQFGMVQARDGNEPEAITSFEKGFQSSDNNVNKPDFALALINLYSLNKMYDNVIKCEGYITEDTTGSLLFYLGEAYFHNGDLDLAGKHFDSYTSKFETNEHNGMVFVDNGITLNPIRPMHLEILGDFYSNNNQNKSCEYYNMGIEILSRPKNDLFYKKQLEAIEDREEKKKFQENHEKFEQEQAELLGRFKKKIKRCN